MKNYRPYVVYTPQLDGNHTSGGVRVMWGLYGWLLAKGMVAYTNVKVNNPDFVGIYPEIMHGNVGEADHVVRYILNKPGVMGGGTDKKNLKAGPKRFDKGDDLYYFSRLFGEAKDDDHYMFLPILSTQLFKPMGLKRTKTAYFVGKDFDLKKHPKDAVRIDGSITEDQAGFARFLNQCEVLYCYDRVTAITEIARLCGCRIVMCNPKFTRDEFAKYEPGMNGISWDIDQGIKLDTERFRHHYKRMKQRFSKKLDLFIERTQCA